MSDGEEDSIEKQLKIVILGDACVGKTSIATRYCHEEFQKHYFPTAGVDFFLKRIILHKVKNVTLQIWDVGGSSFGGSMLDKYIFGAQIAVLVYDITNEVTFDSLEDWLVAVKTITIAQDQPPMCVLMGNKCDMEHQRQVKLENQQRFAAANGMTSHSVSARTGEAVALSFQKMAAEYLGLKLTRSQLEELQPVVKAEIVTHTETPVTRSQHILASRSSVCCIQ